MAGEEHQIAALQRVAVGQFFAKVCLLHIGIAWRHVPLQSEHQLHKARAINSVSAASTPAIGRADQLLCQICR